MRMLLWALMAGAGLLIGDGMITPAISVLAAVEGLGVAPLPEHMTPPLRTRLKLMGVRAGRYALFVPALLKPRAMQVRALLWAVFHGQQPPALPRPGLVSIPRPDWPAGFAARIGWVEAGPVLLRLDIAERIGAELAWETRRRPAALPADLGSRLSLRAESLPPVLRALGIRLLPTVPLPEGQYGPPAPPMMAALRPELRRPIEQSAPALPPPSGPFAVLAHLRG